MPIVDVVDLRNQKVGEVELADEVFAAPVNEYLLYESVKHYRAGIRGGHAKTKTRHEVSGSGKKLWRQKGTGRARMGSIRSPLWRHGGTVHGPVPRDYSYHLPKKMQLGALRSALSAKLRDGELTVVQAFNLDDHRTRTMRAVLDGFDARKNVLLVDVPKDENGLDRDLALGSRNLKGVTLLASREINAYHLLAHNRVLLTEAAARKLSEGLAQ